MQNIKLEIKKVLLSYQEVLSDGYEFYCGGPENVDETLDKLADEICSLLTPREPDACPECGEEYSGACGKCAVGHERG